MIESQRQLQLTFDGSLTTIATAVEVVEDEQTTSEHYFSTNINLGWQKLNDYYARLDDTPVYVTAIILHPAMRFRYLEKKWTVAHKTAWITKARKQFNEHLQEYEYKEFGSDEQARATIPLLKPPLLPL